MQSKPFLQGVVWPATFVVVKGHLNQLASARFNRPTLLIIPRNDRTVYAPRLGREEQLVAWRVVLHDTAVRP